MFCSQFVRKPRLNIVKPNIMYRRNGWRYRDRIFLSNRPTLGPALQMFPANQILEIKAGAVIMGVVLNNHVNNNNYNNKYNYNHNVHNLIRLIT